MRGWEPDPYGSMTVMAMIWAVKLSMRASTIAPSLLPSSAEVGAEKVAEFCIVKKGGNLLDLAFIACPTQAAINIPVGKKI